MQGRMENVILLCVQEKETGLVNMSWFLIYSLYQSGFLQEMDGTLSWGFEFNEGTIYRGVNGVKGISMGFWSIH